MATSVKPHVPPPLWADARSDVGLVGLKVGERLPADLEQVLRLALGLGRQRSRTRVFVQPPLEQCPLQLAPVVEGRRLQRHRPATRAAAARAAAALARPGYPSACSAATRAANGA